MQTSRYRQTGPAGRRIALALLFLITCGCAAQSAVVGRWQSLEGPGGVVFHADGTFEAVDNQGMPVDGKYRMKGTDGVRFEIEHANNETESIDARMSREGDRLTLIFSDQDAVENYQLVP